MASDLTPSLRDISNRTFVVHLGSALAYLGVSAAILTTLFVLWSAQIDANSSGNASASSVEALHISGAEFTPRLSGGSIFEGRTVVVTGLKNGEAVLAKDLSLKASDYQFLHVTAQGLHPGLKLFLFWQTIEQPGGVFYAEVPLKPGGSGWYKLTRKNVWKGTVRKLEIGVFGDMRGGDFRLQSVSLYPIAPRPTLGTVWTEWLNFTPWDQASINAYVGGPADADILPVVAASAWCSLAMALVLVHTLLRKVRSTSQRPSNQLSVHARVTCLTIIAIGWFTLECLWLSKVMLQASETRYSFAGKSIEERKLADWDGQYYRLATQIKMSRTTEREKLSILLPQGETNTVFAHRLRYHLLPEVFAHHVAEADVTQLQQAAEVSDLILALSTSKPFQHSLREQLELTLADDEDLEVVVESPLGLLTRITSSQEQQ